MPSEDRRLIFDYEETYKAIYTLSVKKEKPKPPAGMITGVDIDEADKNSFIFQIENPQKSVAVEMTYSKDFLAAALMLYCRACGIPLPRKAQKSVMLADEKVILRIMI